MLAPLSMMCGSWTLASWACCATSLACNVCCSVAGCFTCASNKLTKALYMIMFLASALLGIFLRYYGEQALSSWVKVMQLCDNGQCWGVEANYRISAALTGFFFIMMLLCALLPAAHLSAWLLKLLFYILLLGVSLAIPNSFFDTYAEISRYLSILFILVQCIILVDFAYCAHEWLLAKMDATDAALDAAGWEAGVCSNGWKVLYVLLSATLGFGSIAAIGVMYAFFGKCSLMQFFLSETLVVGCLFILVSMPLGKGMLPSTILFAYNTYLVYGAITNNPDGACNRFALAENTNQGSIFAGLAITALSITWAAYASAGSMYSLMKPTDSAATVQRAVPTSGDAEVGQAKDWAGAAPPSGAAAAYDTEKGSDASSKASTTSSASTSSSGAAAAAAAEEDEAPQTRAWVFHLIMALAALYLAMLLTNWGTASQAASNGNPEMSVASMWVRMVSQWLIYILYGWTLIAPVVCPGRSFD